MSLVDVIALGLLAALAIQYVHTQRRQDTLPPLPLSFGAFYLGTLMVIAIAILIW